MYEVELDRLDGRLLRVRGNLCAADWSELELDEHDYLLCEPEIVVRLLLPEGGQHAIGAIDDQGVIDVKWSKENVTVTVVAPWSEIELLPDWSQPDEQTQLWGEVGA